MPAESSMDDGFVTFGWPFDVYGYGGFWTHHVIIWTGIIGNVFLAFCCYRIAEGFFACEWCVSYDIPTRYRGRY